MFNEQKSNADPPEGHPEGQAVLSSPSSLSSPPCPGTLRPHFFSSLQVMSVKQRKFLTQIPPGHAQTPPPNSQPPSVTLPLPPSSSLPILPCEGNPSFSFQPKEFCHSQLRPVLAQIPPQMWSHIWIISHLFKGLNA